MTTRNQKRSAAPKKKKSAPSSAVEAELEVFLKAEDGFFGNPDYGEVTFGVKDVVQHYLEHDTDGSWAKLFESIRWLGQEADGGLIGLYEGAVLYLDNEGSLRITGKTLVDHFATIKDDQSLEELLAFVDEHGLRAPLSPSARAASVKAVPSPEERRRAFVS